MKRIASAVLLSLFLYNLIGCYFTISVLNWQNNAQMNIALMRSSSLEYLHIKQADLKNVIMRDDGKEIVYNGEIYDVKEKCVEGDLVTFLCLKDVKEKKLLAELNNHVRNNIDTKSPQHDKNPGKQLQKNIAEYLLSDMKVVAFYLSSQEIPFSYSDKLIGCCQTPLTAPPKVSFS